MYKGFLEISVGRDSSQTKLESTFSDVVTLQLQKTVFHSDFYWDFIQVKKNNESFKRNAFIFDFFN